MEEKLKTICSDFDAVRNRACDLVEKEARKILLSHSNYKEYIMAMGSCFFVEKDNTNHDGMFGDVRNETKRFFEMVNELDDVFKVMGDPMRFTSKGEKITDW